MVAYPHLRDELIRILGILSDLEAQRRQWAAAQVGDGYFTIAMHFLLDDSSLADAPFDEIGFILENENEAKAIGMVTQTILRVFRKIGNNLSVEMYLEQSDWIQVVNTADLALAVFTSTKSSE